MKAIEKYFPMVLFIILYKVGLTFESVDEILKCADHSNESHWSVLSCGAVYYTAQGRSNFWVYGRNPKMWPGIQMKAIEKYFPVILFIMLYKVILTLASVDEILKCGYSNESYWEVLSCDTVYYTVQGRSNFWVSGLDEILKCDHSNESYWSVLSCGAVYYAAQGRSNFWFCWCNPKVRPFKWKLLSSTVLYVWCCLFGNTSRL